MIEQRNNVLWFKINGVSRFLLAHFLSKALPLFIINEYPKSGGSWIGEMLSDALDIPFPRNRLPLMKSSILHGHMMNDWNINNALIVWRDGRDIIVSQYFHSLFENERGNSRLVKQTRADLCFSDYLAVERNLPSFIEYIYEVKRYPKFTWVDFVKKWSENHSSVFVKYEDIHKDPAKELINLTYQLANFSLDPEIAEQIVSRHSFENLSGRRAGDEDTRSFMRKGIVGDWKNYFSPESRVKFNSYASEALSILGYEENENWLSSQEK
jgi:hypothetical protein